MVDASGGIVTEPVSQTGQDVGRFNHMGISRNHDPTLRGSVPGNQRKSKRSPAEATSAGALTNGRLPPILVRLA